METLHPSRRPTDADLSLSPSTTPAGGVGTPGAGGATSTPELRVRLRVFELKKAIDSQIDELREQVRMPGQQGIIGWLEVARELLEEADGLLGRAERALGRTP